MLDFLRGDADVLVCTTIIESGIDIPQANTLIVERADRSASRSSTRSAGASAARASAPTRTCFYPSARADREARDRLATLADYTELGAGFKIAMRDLEIRGAGNLLGDEQSGHVAALGFELYVQMLDEAVRALAGTSADGEAPRAGAPRRQRRRLRAGRLHPLRAGQDRRPPAHRGRARGRRADRAARGARGPLRPARAAREPDQAPAGAHQARPADALLAVAATGRA
jgi:superfamily II DNA/RNA helicase